MSLLWDEDEVRRRKGRSKRLPCNATLACSWPCVHHEHDKKGNVVFVRDYEELSVAADVGCAPCGSLKQGLDAACACRLLNQRISQLPPWVALLPHRCRSIEYRYGVFTAVWACARGSRIDIDIRLLQGSVRHTTTTSNRRNGYEPPHELLMGEIHRDPLSPRAIRLYRRWLVACDDGHKACQQGPRPMPTRVLDLRRAEDCDDCVRLVAPDRLHDQYVALSYCWGAARPLITNTLNRSSHEQGMTCSTLPQTYRDAVNLCRSLGFRYLWIDSICITQDDDEERVQEISKMYQIFHGAALVIIAASAASVYEGFLSHRTRGLWRRHPHRRGLASLAGQVRERQHSRFSNTDCCSMDPISKRGWTYQERTMARRSIIFCRDEAVWECGEACECECSLQCTPLKPQRLEVSQITAENAQSIWRAVVQESSARELSVPTDRLSAIAAIAGALQPTLGVYLAGLWRNNLLPQLLWRATPRLERRRGSEYQRQGISSDEVNYPNGVAPTFSWASCAGCISTVRLDKEFSAVRSHDVGDATVIHASYDFSSLNGVGRHTGVLVLDAYVCEAIATVTGKQDNRTELLSKSGLRLPIFVPTDGLERPLRSTPASGDDEDARPIMQIDWDGISRRAGAPQIQNRVSGRVLLLHLLEGCFYLPTHSPREQGAFERVALISLAPKLTELCILDEVAAADQIRAVSARRRVRII